MRWDLPPETTESAQARADTAELRQLLALVRRAAHKRGERRTKKAAITGAELQALLATCGPDLAGVRDRALLHFGFASGGHRRSEVAAATLAHLRALPEGGRRCVSWTRARRYRPGWRRPASLKRPCSGGSGATGSVPRLSDRAIALIIQRRAALAGLAGLAGLAPLSGQSHRLLSRRGVRGKLSGTTGRTSTFASRPLKSQCFPTHN